jgi:hypothetical protein
MRRRVRSSMLKFAKTVDAIRNGRPDWYAVAEFLAPFAAEQFPELLSDDVPARGRPGRPHKENWYWLVHDVDLVRRQQHCTIKKACLQLAKGEAPHLSRITLGSGERRSVWILQSGKWKGEKPRTLEQRYYEWMRGWKKESAERSIKIKLR